jgi:Subtilase family
MPTLVQLTTPGAALSPELRAARARLVSAPLDVWRVPAGEGPSVVAALHAEHALARAEPDRRIVSFAHLSAGDPLIPNEWWIHDVGDDRAEPPGPGVPLTVIDSGLDLTHPEFSARPDTTALNRQFVTGPEDVHGTAVSSVAAAPSNGQGLVGVYPRANLREWDFGDGALSDILAGLDAASKRGRGIVNFSGGFLGYSSLMAQAVDRALHRGVIVVAAAGNDRQFGNRLFVPAGLPHVLTAAATNQKDHVAFFSSRSKAIDLAAPGVAMPVAVPASFNPGGYATFDGTSFSSPLVAGAAAWIWTVRPQLDATQLEDVLRDSARDVAPSGWDADTGFGILSIPAALGQRPRAKDPQEPNDNIALVRPHAVTAAGTRLPTPAFLHARVDAREDPEDVYRVWVPGGGRIAARTRSPANVNLALWGPRTRSVFERGSALRRDLLAFSERPRGRSDAVSGRNNARRGAYYYVDVFLGKRVARTAYSLSVSVARR